MVKYEEKDLVTFIPPADRRRGKKRYMCNVCRKKIYAGILLLSAPRLQTLLDTINKVINVVGASNTTKLKAEDGN